MIRGIGAAVLILLTWRAIKLVILLYRLHKAKRKHADFYTSVYHDYIKRK